MLRLEALASKVRRNRVAIQCHTTNQKKKEEKNHPQKWKLCKTDRITQSIDGTQCYPIIG